MLVINRVYNSEQGFGKVPPDKLHRPVHLASLIYDHFPDYTWLTIFGVNSRYLKLQL